MASLLDVGGARYPLQAFMSGSKTDSALRAFIVSHSRWETDRIHLVRMVDEVLAILRDEPRFAAFTLDAQTVTVTDYLEIRPERRNEIAEHVAAGRLVLGPCYVSSDEFLVSGEALVRNLQRGLATVREFGGECRDGYMPDGSGHMVQMPQILAGFGLRSCLLVRGVPRELFERAGVEFAWEAPDGSRVLALYLLDGLDNAGSRKRIEDAVAALEPHARSGVLLLWNGGTDLGAQREMPQLLSAARSTLPRVEFVHGGFRAAIDEIEALRTDLEVHRGALLGHARSAGIDAETENHEVQSLLEKHAEPLAAALGSRAGREHAALLDSAWQDLLLGHARHGSADNGRYRLRRARETAQSIVDDALRVLALRSGFSRKDGVEVLAVHNPHLEAWSGTVSCIVEWPSALDDDALDALALHDPDGKPVRVQVESIDPAGQQSGTLLSVEFAAKLPPCGVAFYRLVQGGAGPQGFDEVVAGGQLENEHLLVQARHDGSLSILHKASGRKFEGALAYESRSDHGDLDAAWSTTKGSAKVQAWRSATAAHMSISILWKLPWIEPKERERLALHLDTIVRLEDGSSRLEFETVLDTDLTDHRLRVLLPLPLGTTSLTTDQAFALVRCERATELAADAATQFSSTFVHAADPEAAVLVSHRGLHEHEIVDAPTGSIAKGPFLALTLWRGVDAQHLPDGLVLRTAFEIVPGQESSAHSAARAATFAFPPRAEQVRFGAEERGAAERVPARRSFLRCDDPRVALSALRVEADGRIVVRVWNRGDAPVRVTLQLGHDLVGAKPPSSARRMRLDLADVGPVELTGTIARFELRPSAIETIVFYFEANP